MLKQRILFVILHIVYAFLLTNIASGNTDKEVSNKFNVLENLYNEKQLSESQYLQKIDSFAYYLISVGFQMESENLLKLLEPYHDITWGNKKYSKYKERYYAILKNNAKMAGKGGEAVFYAEKMDEESKKNGGQPTISETYEKCYFHIVNNNYAKASKTYEEAIDLIKKYPDFVKENKISSQEILDLMGLNALIISAHIKEKDTLKIQRSINISEQIRENVLKGKNYTLYDQLCLDLFIKMLYKDQAYFLNDLKKSEREALEMLEIVHKNESTLGNFSEFVKIYAFESLIDTYLTMRDYPNAEKYIQKYEKMPDQLIDQAYLTEHFKSDLYAGQEKYKEAFELLSKSIKNKDNVYTALANEMDELLYAHTEAEFNKLALGKVERAKRNRLIIIIVISVLALVIILATYLLMRRKANEANARIQKLNDMVNMQITVLEEVKLQATREEQQRLGKELHDGLAASIAGIKHSVELVAMDEDRNEQKVYLNNVIHQLGDAYHKVRQKSHDWYNNSDKSLEQSFENRIRDLMDSALPNNHYNKIVEIDIDALQYVNLNIRIELLRIIQEAIVNIIKHAKSKSISMLMYEDEEHLILSIKDDGKGFEPTKASKKSLGIKSMIDRVTKMSGTLDIISGSKGTELIVSIPLLKIESI